MPVKTGPRDEPVFDQGISRLTATYKDGRCSRCEMYVDLKNYCGCCGARFVKQPPPEQDSNTDGNWAGGRRPLAE